MLEAVEATALATWLRYAEIAYPLVSAMHIMAIGSLFGTVLLMDLRLLGLWPALPNVVLDIAVRPVAVGAFAAAAATGLMLFSVSATDYAANPAFRAKLGLLAAALLNVLWVHRSVAWRQFSSGGPITRSLRLGAVVSLATWIAVLVAGRFIGFV